MATTLQTLIDRTRVHLIETSAFFWSDAELLVHANDAIQDLWKAIKQNYQDYFLTVDVTNVSLVAGAYVLAGVPADVSIVRGVEPRDLASYPYTKFEQRPWGHRDFVAARGQGTQVLDQIRLFYYCPTDAGAPVAAPTIRVAPAVSTTLLLTLSYIPILAYLAATANNPIPGQTDDILVARMVAYARAKEREDRSPDLVWLATYQQSKLELIASVTPRTEDEEEVTEAIFQPWW